MGNRTIGGLNVFSFKVCLGDDCSVCLSIFGGVVAFYVKLLDSYYNGYNIYGRERRVIFNGVLQFGKHLIIRRKIVV